MLMERGGGKRVGHLPLFGKKEDGENGYLLGSCLGMMAGVDRFSAETEEGGRKGRRGKEGGALRLFASNGVRKKKEGAGGGGLDDHVLKREREKGKN